MSVTFTLRVSRYPDDDKTDLRVQRVLANLTRALRALGLRYRIELRKEETGE